MRPINLLPPEAFEKAKTRRRFLLIAVALLAYVAVLALLVFWWNGRVDRAEQEVADQEQVNAQLLAEIAVLAEARNLADRYDANVLLIQDALSTDVSFGRVLNDLARMLPERVWIQSFSASASDEAVAGLGVVSVSGVGFDYADVSAWLRSLDSDRFPSVGGTWVPSVSESQIGEADTVTFSSSATITDAARSRRIDDRIPAVIR